MAKRRIFAGRYEYVKPLGRGAGGAVYLCKDIRESQGQVALKVLSAEAFATVQGKMLRREFEILSKLKHPNLVRVYDYGPLPDGGVFLAEEYIDGFSLQDARALLEPSAMIDVTMQMLRGLAYLHGMGMIHRDIKPANVMLLWLDDENARPMVKLVDFGLSSADPKRDTLRGGTRSYMAPEIIRGEKGELRSDLYSLGVTLYYAMCGVLPFGPRTKDDPPPTEENFRPPEPHRLNPEVPLAFSRFTMVLLRQVEDVDYADAGEALKALANDNESLEWVSSGHLASSIDIAAPPVLRGYFERGILLHQESQRDILVDEVQGDGRRGALHLVRGAEGVGKSRLAREVASTLKLRGKVVVQVPCRALRKEPFTLLLEMLRETLGIAESREVEIHNRFRPLLSMLSRLAPWIGHTKGVEERTVEYNWIRLALEHLSNAMAPDQLVYVIEDLHLADSLSVEFLEQWFDNEDVSIRPSLIATAEEGHDTDKLSVNSGCELMESKGLRREDVEYFFRQRLGVGEIPDAWLEQVATLSKGNPAYIEELCRHFIDSGALTRASAIQWNVKVDEVVSFSLPKGQRESLRRRLAALGTVGREALELLSVVNQRLEWSVLRKLLLAGGESADNAERTIELLIWRHFLYLDLEQSGRYLRLIDTQLRDVILSRMNPEWKRSLERRIGDRLRKNWMAGLTKPQKAAEHLLAGGDVERARVMYETAGDLAFGQSEFENAMTYYRHTFESIEHEPSIALVGAKLANTSMRVLETELAISTLERAWIAAERTALEWIMFRVCDTAVDVFLTVDRPTDAQDWIGRLRDISPVLSTSGAIFVAEARLLALKGNLESAREKLKHAINQAQHYGENGTVIWSMGLLGRVEHWDGNMEHAINYFEDAVALGEHSDNRGALGWAMCGLGAAQRDSGDLRESYETLTSAFELVSRHAEVDLWIETLIEIAETQRQRGLVDEARTRAAEARRLAHNLDHNTFVARTEALSARLAPPGEGELKAIGELVAERMEQPHGFPHNVFAVKDAMRAFEEIDLVDESQKLGELIKQHYPQHAE